MTADNKYHPLSDEPVRCVYCGLKAFRIRYLPGRIVEYQKWFDEPLRECESHRWEEGHDDS